MSIVFSVVAFLIIFSLLILVHEFGHFWAAKKAGVKVEEFGFGLPPRAWGKKVGGTLYSLNWIPFGGFVRMLGEDSRDPKMLTEPKSFASKSLRARIVIVVAGVVANFLLAIVLLTVGFSFGIQPLLLSPEDVFQGIEHGVIQIQTGATVKSVVMGSSAEKAGFKTGDIVFQIDGNEVVDAGQLEKFFVDGDIQSHRFMVRRDNAILQIDADMLKSQKFGLGFYELFLLPRVVIKEVKEDFDAYRAGLRAGDILIQMNGEHMYSAKDFQEKLLESSHADLKIMRNHRSFEYSFDLPVVHTVVIAEVFLDSIASKAGFQKGDILVQVEDHDVRDPEKLLAYAKERHDKNLRYTVDRGGKLVTLTANPDENGRIGVGLTRLISQENSVFNMYTTDVLTSVLEVRSVSFPVHLAFVESLRESKRLIGLTAVMFGRVIQTVVSRFEVPEGVAGPVGIAKLTHVFVQEGILSLVRFLALLSLSLSVINIFPLPALDGGRLLFLLFEVFAGRRINQRWEAMIHAIGLVILLLLLIAVTYSDVMSLF